VRGESILAFGKALKDFRPSEGSKRTPISAEFINKALKVIIKVRFPRCELKSIDFE
jgi:hypothetical protein